MSGLLPVAEAQARLLSLARPIATEQVPLAAAIDRWAAEDVTPRRDQPARDLSAMDGYAIRFDDLPGPLDLVGESPAGRPFAGSIGPNQTVRIFTGAVMPDGADTVLIQEEAARDGARVSLHGDGPDAKGRNVRPRGLDFSTGDVLVAAGERLTPARLALVAIGGHGTVNVARRVRVAIAATGDELMPTGTPLKDGELPESNRLLLAGMLAGLPVELIDLGILRDDPDTLRDAFACASAGADLIVTTGGASVGDHDLVRPALEAAGGTIDFWRIALRPGKPVLAGRLNEAIVIGLPGNPVSAFVTCELFVKPMIAALAGARAPLPRPRVASLGEDLPGNGPRTDYLRGQRRGGRVYVAAIQDSSMLRTLARADCLVIRDAHAPPARAGDSVEVLEIA